MAHELNLDLVPGLRQGESANPRAENVFSLGPGLDGLVAGGLERAALHEVIGAPGEGAPALAFALAMSLCATTPHSRLPSHGYRLPLLWVRQEAAADETGPAYAPGLVDLGLDPSRLTIVTLGRTLDALRAALDATRCPALGAVILETTDTGRTVDLTATRRLALAAEVSGATVLVVRLAGGASANAARTRWRVGAAPSRTLTGDELSCFGHSLPPNGSLPPGVAERQAERAGAGLERGKNSDLRGLGPGRPCFDITLLKRRAGVAGLSAHVEWNRDRRIFEEALSLPLAAVPGRRRLAA